MSPTMPRWHTDPLVHETRGHAALEADRHVARTDGCDDHLHGQLTDRAVFAKTSLREPALSAVGQAGLVNNVNDGLAWRWFRSSLPRRACRSPGSGCWPRTQAGVLAAVGQKGPVQGADGRSVCAGPAKPPMRGRGAGPTATSSEL
jgi:hypothetical protein